MNWCYDCIFQGVWKYRKNNAIIKFPKTKYLKISEFSLISFVGMPVLCVALFVLVIKVVNFFHDFITFNLKEIKGQTGVTIFLYCNYAGGSLYFITAFISGHLCCDLLVPFHYTAESLALL